MIKELTKEQEALIPVFVKRWTKIGMDTNPINLEKCQNEITAIYQQLDATRPEFIVTGSPLMTAWLVGLLKNVEIGAELAPYMNHPLEVLRQHSVLRAALEAERMHWVDNDIIPDETLAELRQVYDANALGLERSSIVTDLQHGNVVNKLVNWVSGYLGTAVSKRPQDGVLSVLESILPIGTVVREPYPHILPEAISILLAVLPALSTAHLETLTNSARTSLWDAIFGSQDAHWLSFYSFFREAVGLVEETEPVMPLIRLAEVSGWWWPYESACFIQERALEIHVDEQGRLHNWHGPAISFRDGYAVYAIEGNRVPEWWFREGITHKDVSKENNAERKRQMIRVGWKNDLEYAKSADLKELDSDPEFGRLLVKRESGDEDIYLLHLRNMTPDPETGVRREYYFPIPRCKTAKEAFAHYWQAVTGGDPAVLDKLDPTMRS